MLEIQTLGQYKVKLDGRQIELRSRSSQQLLAYLAVNETKKHSRDALVELFWADSSLDIGRRYLRNALGQLRKAAGKDPRTGSEYILNDRNFVWLNLAAGIHSDVSAILRAAGTPPRTDQLLPDLELYEGEFLPGFSEDWVLLERARLKTVFNRKSELLIDLLVNDKRWPEVASWAERWIALERAPEAAFRALMIAHASQGHLSQVKADYERCVLTLQKELGITPSELTSRTYHQLILQGELEEAQPNSAQAEATHELPENVASSLHRKAVHLERPGDSFIPSNSLVNDRYRLDQELGSGFMGVVFQAFDTLLGRPVALKMLKREHLGVDGYFRLIQEAQTIARINHPNIVTIFDAGEVDGIPYMVMELLHGEMLTAHIPKAIPEVRRILLQICDALKQVHSYGIVHRDLKPENVMILPDGNTKLMDFGLAHYDTSRITREGEILGTVHYLSPEQALGKPVDPRTDIYALGIMTYELLTGKLPYGGDNLVTVITQHLYSPPVPISELNPDIPLDFAQLVHKMMSKSPDERPGSIDEVMDGLLRIESGGPGKAEQPSPETRVPELEFATPAEISPGRLETKSGIHLLLHNWRSQGVEILDASSLALIHSSPPETKFDQEDLLFLFRSVLHRQLELDPWIERAGTKTDAVNVLGRLLDEYPRPEIRMKIVRGLELIGSEPAAQLLLRIGTSDDAPAVRTEASLAAARLGLKEQVFSGILADLSNETDLAAMAAFVVLVDEYGLPADAAGYPKFSLSINLLQRRLRLYGKLIWRQGIRCAFGGAVFLALNGMAAPLLTALSDPAQYEETLEILTVPAWMIISALGLLILGLFQGMSSGLLVGFADAAWRPPSRQVFRSLLGAISGLLMTFYLSLFTAIGATVPNSPPAVYHALYVVYGLLMGWIISRVIPPLVLADRMNSRALRTAIAAAAAALASIPFVYLVYEHEATEFLLSRIVLSVMLVLGIAIAARNPIRTT